MKGVGVEHQELMSATSICECKHSHLYVSLISARLCRATPFEEKKTPIFGVEKGLRQKNIYKSAHLRNCKRAHDAFGKSRGGLLNDYGVNH